jgi:hypothetical protein
MQALRPRRLDVTVCLAWDRPSLYFRPLRMGVPCLSFRRKVKITEGLAAGESPYAVSESGSEQERLRVMERGHAPYPLMVARPTCRLGAEALAYLGFGHGVDA